MVDYQVVLKMRLNEHFGRVTLWEIVPRCYRTAQAVRALPDPGPGGFPVVDRDGIKGTPTLVLPEGTDAEDAGAVAALVCEAASGTTGAASAASELARRVKRAWKGKGPGNG